jgi:putative hydrolase of HD superfamily
MTDAEKVINLIRYGESLKNIDRTGWILAGIESKKIESVAEHSYGCAFTAIIIANQLKAEGIIINLGKVALLAVLHDIPEAITGDIARTREFAENEELVNAKKIAEKDAIAAIFEPTENSYRSLHRYWNEFDAQNSAEAIIVKAADCIDMLIHARKLEDSGISPELLHQFFDTSQKIIKDIGLEIVIGIFNKLFAEHNAMLETQK